MYMYRYTLDSVTPELHCLQFTQQQQFIVQNKHSMCAQHV